MKVNPMLAAVLLILSGCSSREAGNATKDSTTKNDPVKVADMKEIPPSEAPAPAARGPVVKTILKPDHATIVPFAENLFGVCREAPTDGGAPCYRRPVKLQNASGKILMEQEVTVMSVEKHAVIVTIGDGWAQKYGFMTLDGTFSSPPLFDQVFMLGDWLACGRTLGQCQEGRKPEFGNLCNNYALIDLRKREIQKPGYELVSHGVGGPVMVKQNGKFGFLGQDGSPVVPIRFEDAESCSENLCPAVLDGKTRFHDPAGVAVLTVNKKCRGFHDGLAPCQAGEEAGADKGRWGFIDKSGKWAINPSWDEVGHFRDGLAPVAEKDASSSKLGWGFINKDSKLLIGPRYQQVKGIEEGVAIFDGRTLKDRPISEVNLVKPVCHAVNQAGEVIFMGDCLVSRVDGYLAVPLKDSGNSELIDIATGETIRRESFEARSIHPLNRALIEIEGAGEKFGVGLPDGKIILPMKYDAVGATAHMIIASIEKGDKEIIWLFDYMGKPLSKTEYSQLYCGLKKEYCSFARAGSVGFMDAKGKEICQLKGDELRGIYADGFAAFRQGGKWGFMDNHCKVLSAPEWDSAFWARDGFYQVLRSGKWGVVQVK